jgi:magnesium transporter
MPDRPAPPPSTIRTIVCRGGLSIERDVDLADVAEHLADPTDVVWTDVRGPGPDELDALAEAFGLDPSSIEDLQRSRIHEFAAHTLITTHALRRAGGGDDPPIDPIAIFVGRNFVVTIHPATATAIDDAVGRWLGGGGALAEGVPFALSTVFDAILATYLPEIDRIDDALDRAEIEIFEAARAPDVQVLLRLKRDVTGLRRVLSPLQDNLKTLLRPDNRVLGPDLRQTLQEAQGELLRVLELLDGEREMATATLEASFTVASGRLNQTMKSLALVTVVLAIGSSVFGAWGMNFDALPLRGEPWGFWAVIGGTIALAAVALLLGRERRGPPRTR